MTQENSLLLEPFKSTALSLKNKIVMAPLTRCRATSDHVPTDIMATYYAQRASAGLIVTEGTSSSPNGVGYARMPGIYNKEQILAWKKITDKVHGEGGIIFLQIMHTGRVSHVANMPEGSVIIAPSAIAPAGTEMYTDQQGNQPITTPKAMTDADIDLAISEHVQAAQNAIEAGFDGVELHGANGYLIEQFINPGSNRRTDGFGGSKENRTKFLIEIANRVSTAIGSDKVGVRLSPGGAFNDVNPFEGELETFNYLASELGKLELAYLHLVDHAAMGAPEVPVSLRDSIVKNFNGTVILSGGYDKERAEEQLSSGGDQLIAFGRPFIANPDLVSRFANGSELNAPDFDTFYTPGEKGYTDYPSL